MTFTTRPELRGDFGMVASTHWIASAAGMGVLERGGNAYDAAVAAGFVLQVVEPHLNGPGGDLPILHRPAGGAVEVICGQGPAPAAATLEHYLGAGLTRVPGAGLLATVIPGAFDAWCLMLRDRGTRELSDVLAPAIHYARAGHPLLPGAARQIATMEPVFREVWPSSAAVWLQGGRAPAPGEVVRNPDLAATWERILREAEGAGSREARIDAARDAFYRGFVAERIGAFMQTEITDATGARRRGVLTAEDMAGHAARVEAPLAQEHGDWTIHKTGPWGQGPVLHLALNILREAGVDAAEGADVVHLVIEALKLAMADREAYFGDPDDSEIPLGQLMSRAYAAERAALIGAEASRAQRPGAIAGLERWAARAVERAAEVPEQTGGIGTGEPTMGHLGPREGDTCHLDVVDAAGNVVSATPSGGWLQSSPTVPGLGFAMNSRAQMFWLEEGLPTSLAPGRRPRTTLSPSLATRAAGTALAFGTPGGDQQDQWQTVFALRLMRDAGNLQALLDAPLFHSVHFQPSFAPRIAQPGVMLAEPALGEAVIAALRARGHEVEVTAPWAIGRLTAAEWAPDGWMRAAATPRLMQAYAVGR